MVEVGQFGGKGGSSTGDDDPGQTQTQKKDEWVGREASAFAVQLDSTKTRTGLTGSWQPAMGLLSSAEKNQNHPLHQVQMLQ